MSREAHSTFSVVVCTHNRVRLLEGAIRSVLGQRYPRDRFELVVVDNASSDGTRALVESCVASAPIRVSYHREDRLGVAFARNLGIDRSRHEFVAYLDDDVVAGSDWLDALDAAIRSCDAQAIGGRIDPVLEPGVDAPPWWTDVNVRNLFGLDHGRLHPGQSVVAIRWPLWLGTGNSAYSKSLLRRLGGFRTDFGPTGRRRRVAEDIHLNLQIERAGVPIHYAHDAVVTHRVTADQVTRRAIWRRTYWSGVMHAVAVSLLGLTSAAGSPSRLARAAARFVVSREPERTAAGCRLAFGAGYLRKRLGVAPSFGPLPPLPSDN